MHKLPIIIAAIVLAACQQATDVPSEQAPAPAPEPAAAPPTSSLEDILEAQQDEVRARYQYRHPRETLEFFDVQPGMTVVEALPGGGWYTKILLPAVGPDGKLIGADYAQGMYPLFGFFDSAFIEAKKTWVSDWTDDAREWSGDGGAAVSAFAFGSLPEEMYGTADRMLFIRALHNLARFEGQGQFLTKALTDAFNVLKPGGIVGVVQHHARDEMPDEWADGSNGYLKKPFVIAQMQAAGFELLGESDINANANDQPTTEDFVWRLPPSYQGNRDNAEMRAELDKIGESNRMTLKFRKPE